MLLPLGVALFALGVASAATTLLSHGLAIAQFAPILGSLIGLGVGIDYALFIVTRSRQGLRRGLSVEDADRHGDRHVGPRRPLRRVHRVHRPAGHAGLRLLVPQRRRGLGDADRRSSRCSRRSRCCPSLLAFQKHPRALDAGSGAPCAITGPSRRSWPRRLAALGRVRLSPPARSLSSGALMVIVLDRPAVLLAAPRQLGPGPQPRPRPRRARPTTCSRRASAPDSTDPFEVVGSIHDARTRQRDGARSTRRSWASPTSPSSARSDQARKATSGSSPWSPKSSPQAAATSRPDHHGSATSYIPAVDRRRATPRSTSGGLTAIFDDFATVLDGQDPARSSGSSSCWAACC